MRFFVGSVLPLALTPALFAQERVALADAVARALADHPQTGRGGSARQRCRGTPETGWISPQSPSHHPTGEQPILGQPAVLTPAGHRRLRICSSDGRNWWKTRPTH